MTEMLDMARFIEAKSDQLNADDLIGQSKTITVTKVTGSDGDQPVSIHYQGDNGKPFKPCKTIRRVLVGVWGRNAADYVGRSMTLYRDDKVTFGGLEVGGIRISHMSHIDDEMTVVVMRSKGKKAGIKIHPLRASATTEPDKAAAWATAFIKEMFAQPDLAALAALDEKHSSRLSELKEKRPELHATIVTASAEKRAVIEAASVSEHEGRGEAFSGADESVNA